MHTHREWSAPLSHMVQITVLLEEKHRGVHSGLIMYFPLAALLLDVPHPGLLKLHLKIGHMFYKQELLSFCW